MATRYLAFARLRTSLIAAISIAASSSAALGQTADQNVVLLDSAGRTLSAPASWDAAQPVEIRFRGNIGNVCENLRLSFAWHNDVREPEPLFSVPDGAYEKIETLPLTGCGQENPYVRIARPATAMNMLSYTVWQIRGSEPDDETERVADTKLAIEKELTRLRPLFDPPAQLPITNLNAVALGNLKAAIKTEAGKLDEAIKKRAEVITAGTRRLKGLDEDAKLFSGTSDPAGVQKLRDILDEVRTARAALEGVQDQQSIAQRDSKSLLAIHERLVEGQDVLVRATCTANVLKVGGLLPLGQSKSVFYNFADSPAPPGVALILMGGYPRVTQDDRLFAIVANRALGKHRYPFVLSASRATSAPPILAPVRPTFDVAKAITAGDQLGGLFKTDANATATAACTTISAVAASLDTAFRDTILPFQDRFAGNDVLTVSISTYMPQVSTDKVTTTTEGAEPKVTKQTVVEAKMVDLIDSVKYPQVRAMYRFNFATGAIVSSLRDPSFVRVKTAANDGSTSGVDEARYQLETSDGPGRVFPAFLFSTYLKRVDIQQPVWGRCGRLRCPGWRMLPAPSLGFSMASPADNVFVGVTSEFMENVHLFVGRHNGKVNELVEPRDATGNVISVERADQDSADAKTRTRRVWDWSAGVTFNINILSNFFK